MALKMHDVEKRVGLKPEQLPRHIAIIMDGNGRWAQRYGRPRFEGHRKGAQTVSRIVLECARLRIKYLTLYSFSMENWRRPREEVEMLMHLFAEYLVGERPNLMEYNTRLLHLGREQELPKEVLAKLRETATLTAGNDGMTLALALNYSSRSEISDAAAEIAQKAVSGQIDVNQISPELISEHLYMPQIPDPDLLIRTADERRLSNFLLWQLSYSEFYISKVLWPDFRERHLHRALKNYAARERRYGDVVPEAQLAAEE